MIYSNDFVWLHFPKCAGTKTERLFSQYFSDEPGLTQDLVGFKLDPEIKWHDSVGMRSSRDPEFQLNGRVIICPFRRLSSWLESRYSFEVKRSPCLQHKPELLLQGQFLEQSGHLSNADSYCETYLPDHLLNSAKIEFIRTEHFKDDFKRVFGSYIDVDRVPDSEFTNKVNASSSVLQKDIHEQLKSPEREIYNACPRWAKIEALAYPA